MIIADRIVATADVCSGRPRIRDTRIRVSNVLEMLAAGMSHAAILEDYPYLTEEDIRACLDYAAHALDSAAVAAE
jgi:uncharacterized protein (DUF433 family)